MGRPNLTLAPGDQWFGAPQSCPVDTSSYTYSRNIVDINEFHQCNSEVNITRLIIGRLPVPFRSKCQQGINCTQGVKARSVQNCLTMRWRIGGISLGLTVVVLRMISGSSRSSGTTSSTRRGTTTGGGGGVIKAAFLALNKKLWKDVQHIWPTIETWMWAGWIWVSSKKTKVCLVVTLDWKKTFKPWLPGY